MNFSAISVNYDEKKSSNLFVPTLIGEIGVNHNGSEELLFKLIDGGIAAGVDVLKFQRFVSRDEISVYAPSADYQVKNKQSKNQLEMAEQLELSDEQLFKVKSYCDEKKIGFLCTAFEHKSVEFLSEKLRVQSIKVPSPEITNIPLLKYISKKFSQLIISTGASDLSECTRALDIFPEHETVMLHCLSEYPAPANELNLKVINTLANEYKVPCGFSDHTNTNFAPIVAASMGAVMIEKHYTLDRSLPGPDHAASATVEEMRELKDQLRELSLMKGDGIKKVAPSEQKNRLLIRKSVTCSVDFLPTGTLVQEKHLAIKRPVYEDSVEPFDIEKIIGRTLKKNKTYDEPFFWSDFQ